MRLARTAWLWAIMLALSACDPEPTPPLPTPDSGTPTQLGRVTGQALLEGGATPEGVSLTLEGTEHRAFADAEGRFTLEDVPAGEHTVVAQQLGYHDARQSVQVRAGETASVMLQLTAEPGALQGVVLHEDESPVPGVRVTLTETGATATTDEQGLVHFGPIVPGTYTVVAEKEGYVRTQQTVRVTNVELSLVTFFLQRELGSVSGTALLEGATTHDGVAITLEETGATATTNAQGHFAFTGLLPGTYTVVAQKDRYVEARQSVDVRLSEAASISLTLARLRGNLSGVIELDDGAEPSDVTIALAETGATTTTDAQGHFAFANLPTGTYSVVARKDGYADGRQSVEIRANEAASVSLTLTRQLGILSGVIQVDDGAALTGVFIFLVEYGFGTITTDQGHFSFGSVPTGTYTLVAQKDGYNEASQSVEVRANETASASFTLTRQRGNLSGVIQVDDATAPSGATVSLVGRSGTATTDAQGRFTFADVPTGTYTVLAQKANYADARQTVEVRTNEMASVSLTLTRQRGNLDGFISLEGTSTARDISVTLAGTTFSTQTSSTGYYSFNGVPTGVYQLEVRKEQFGTGRRSVEIRAGVTTRVNLTLPRARGTVEGLVQFGDGTSAAHVSVELAGSASASSHTMTDEHGRFSFSNTLVGTYTVTATLPGYARQPRTVEVRHEQTTSVTLTMPREQGNVIGKVHLEGAATHEGVIVSLDGHPGTSAPTDVLGRFAIDDVPAGSHTMRASRDHYEPVEQAIDVTHDVPETIELSMTVRGAPTFTSARLAVQGGQLVLTGSGFGETQGTSRVLVDGRPSTTYFAWSDTRVVVRVPHETSPGTREVTMIPGAPLRPSGTGSVRVTPQRTLSYAERDRYLGIRPDNSVVAWGNLGPYGDTPSGLTDVVSVAASGATAMALKADGTVTAWGQEAQGLLAVPDGLSEVVDVQMGYAVLEGDSHFAVALKQDGTVVAWGTNQYGQAHVPAGLEDVVAISVGGWHVLALKADGTIVGWGLGSSRETTIPAGLTNAVAIAAGSGNSVVLRADGSLIAWGRGFFYDVSEVPVVNDAVAIAGGDDHHVALRSDGTLVGWGYGDFGQNSPPSHLGPIGAVSGRARRFSMAIRTDGRPVSWGYTGPWTPEDLVLRVPAR
ncbi:carboxypeptidase regulatory-like domain-containing protein [Myxococcus sp. 1LA]